MEEGICINEWLIREGYLALERYPETPTRPDSLAVNWTRTRAWADGGYYGRLFLNVRGREPQGVIPPEDYEKVRDELAAGLRAIRDPAGRPLTTRVHRPEELYRTLRGVPPDLLVYFGDLSWRSAGTVGTRQLHIEENDTGPDDSNHDWHGVYVMALQGRELKGGFLGARPLYDIAPTILAHFGITPPAEMIGRPLSVPQARG